MSATVVDQLIDHVRRVRAEPGLPYEVARSMTLDDILQALDDVRASFIAATDAAPDCAFDPQPEGEDGSLNWCVGEIIGHANGTAIAVGARAVGLCDKTLGEPPAGLTAALEPRVMSRDEATAAARGLNYRDLFGMVTEGSDLDTSENTDFFGTMSCRAWLYFIAMHEAEHVQQIRDLSA